MAADAEKKETKAVKKESVYEATYTIPELLKAAETEFETTSVVVRAALKQAGKKSYTLNEAKKLIERMKHKEVRA